MNPFTSLSHLFESADKKRARITEELRALKDRVSQSHPKTSSTAYGSDAYTADWVQIGKLEKQLAKLNGTSKPKA